MQNYVQGGRILIKHQAVALRLADMATKLEAVRALLNRAAAAVDAKAPDADALCNMAKLFASEEILKVATHAVELHGGNGMMLDFGVEKVFRDAAIFPHMDGTTDISKFKIVKAMFPHTAGKYAGPEARERTRLVCACGLRGGFKLGVVIDLSQCGRGLWRPTAGRAAAMADVAQSAAKSRAECAVEVRQVVEAELVNDRVDRDGRALREGAIGGGEPLLDDILRKGAIALFK